VAYFTAVIAHTGRGWKARDVEIDDMSSLEDLAAALRLVAIDDQPVMAVIEHEDEWFALVRVDGEEEPSLFVSDFGAGARSHYAELLVSAADVDVDDELFDDGKDDEDESGDGGDGGEPQALLWAGDPEILEDLGIGAQELRKITEDRGDDPGRVLAELGEIVGFAELLEALR
jgi:putative tRNA adenosine deaminase-associated protein